MRTAISSSPRRASRTAIPVYFRVESSCFKPDDASQIKLSYSRRIRRPGTQELNPFPSFFDVQNVFIGNPKLNPEYTDAYEMGFSRSGALGSIQLSPFYRRTTDVIRVDINTSDVIDGREVTSVSFKNLATSNSWGSDLNGQLRLGKRFNGFAASTSSRWSPMVARRRVCHRTR